MTGVNRIMGGALIPRSEREDGTCPMCGAYATSYWDPNTRKTVYKFRVGGPRHDVRTLPSVDKVLDRPPMNSKRMAYNEWWWAEVERVGLKSYVVAFGKFGTARNTNRGGGIFPAKTRMGYRKARLYYSWDLTLKEIDKWLSQPI